MSGQSNELNVNKMQQHAKFDDAINESVKKISTKITTKKFKKNQNEKNNFPFPFSL